MDPRLKTPSWVKRACPEHCLHSFCSLYGLLCVVSSLWGSGGTDGPRSPSALNRPQSFSVLKNLWFVSDFLASVVAVELSKRVLTYLQLPSEKINGPALLH